MREGQAPGLVGVLVMHRVEAKIDAEPFVGLRHGAGEHPVGGSSLGLAPDHALRQRPSGPHQPLGVGVTPERCDGRNRACKRPAQQLRELACPDTQRRLVAERRKGQQEKSQCRSRHPVREGVFEREIETATRVPPCQRMRSPAAWEG